MSGVPTARGRVRSSLADVDPALLADSVLRPQLGVGTRAQLRAAGLADRTISRLVDRGELTHEHRGVYGLSGWPSTALRVAYAGQLAAPSPLAAAASTTALEIQGIEVVRYSAEECLPNRMGGRRADLPPLGRAHLLR